MSNFVFHDEAEVEVDAAYERYRRDNPEAARRFIKALEAKIEFIRRFPLAGTRVDRIHRVVKTVKYPYEIYYRTRTSYVFIVAVAHEKREPGYWKRR